jgi:hypothetical protein
MSDEPNTRIAVLTTNLSNTREKLDAARLRVTQLEEQEAGLVAAIEAEGEPAEPPPSEG